MTDDGCDAWFRVEPPPAPPVVRVYARRKGGRAGSKLTLFEAAPPIADAIKQVRAAGYRQAVAVIK